MSFDIAALELKIALNAIGVDLAVAPNAGPALALDFGLPGPVGPPGGEQTVYITAGVLGSHRVVCLANTGKVDYATNADITHLNRVVGVTVSAASAGAPVTVQFQGVLSDPSFTFNAGPVYVGTNGEMTQTPPATGFLQILGTAINATTLFLHLQEPILLN